MLRLIMTGIYVRLLLTLLAVVISFAVAAIALAHHKEFMGTAYENKDVPGYENFIMSKWALHGTDVV